MLSAAPQELAPEVWQRRARAHRERAQRLTAAHLERRARGEKHAIEDFLFTYYPYKPAQLARWHPGAGVRLLEAAERRDWRYYRAVADAAAIAGDTDGAPDTGAADGAATTDAPSATGDAYEVDMVEYFRVRERTVAYVRELLANTLERTPNFGCFGLHEWAMVYRLTPEQLRHRGLKLRIGHDATDRVVTGHRIACSHFDAYRFFTPEAAPLNSLNLSRDTQSQLEQPACLHAGMDIYKWAIKLGPIVPGELLLDAFELARDIRYVDMQASPYDVSGYGLAAIPIETAAGKREYMRLQQRFAARGNTLRERVLEQIAHATSLLAYTANR